jgi:hypothetical protein
LPLTLVQKIAKSAGAAGKLPAMDRLPFKSVTGDYSFKSGLMTITKFLMDSDKFSAEMAGTVGLAGQQALDLKAAFKLAAGLVGGSVGAILQDEQGRATLNFQVKGTVAEPNAGLDMAATGKQTINAIKQGVGSSLLKRLGFALPASPPTNQPAPSVPSDQSAPPAASSTEQPAQDQTQTKQEKQIQELQNVFKGLFKK